MPSAPHHHPSPRPSVPPNSAAIRLRTPQQRISRFFISAAFCPHRLACRPHASITLVFHAITGLSASRSFPTPPPSIGRQYPYSAIPARTIARAPCPRQFHQPPRIRRRLVHARRTPRMHPSRPQSHVPHLRHRRRKLPPLLPRLCRSHHLRSAEVRHHPIQRHARHARRVQHALQLRTCAAPLPSHPRLNLHMRPHAVPASHPTCSAVHTTSVNLCSAIAAESPGSIPHITRISGPAPTASRTRAPSSTSATPSHFAPARIRAAAQRSAPCPYAFAFTTARTSVLFRFRCAPHRSSRGDTFRQSSTPTVIYPLHCSRYSSRLLAHPRHGRDVSRLQPLLCVAVACQGQHRPAPSPSVEVVHCGSARSVAGSTVRSTPYTNR